MSINTRGISQVTEASRYAQHDLSVAAQQYPPFSTTDVKKITHQEQSTRAVVVIPPHSRTVAVLSELKRLKEKKMSGSSSRSSSEQTRE